MADCMAFPKTADEFIEQYKFTDTKQEYTNGAELMPVFRVKQMLEHYFTKDNNVPSKWIPVTERLPEKEGRYLCVVRIGKSGAVYVQVMNGDSYGFSLNHIYTDDVTHWMPLPEPPKGE